MANFNNEMCDKCKAFDKCDEQYGNEVPPCAKVGVENFNNLQKLKAEIAAIEHKAIGFIGTTEAINILNVVLQELRQLSV
jgi:hypothetical protein